MVVADVFVWILSSFISFSSASSSYSLSLSLSSIIISQCYIDRYYHSHYNSMTIFSQNDVYECVETANSSRSYTTHYRTNHLNICMCLCLCLCMSSTTLLGGLFVCRFCLFVVIFISPVRCIAE